MEGEAEERRGEVARAREEGGVKEGRRASRGGQSVVNRRTDVRIHRLSRHAASHLIPDGNGK